MINPDILSAVDFTFTPYRPSQGGDSGLLQLATSKANPNIQYVVKSSTPELACNELMYHKIAKALGLHTQEVKLFPKNQNGKYAAGIRFSPNAKKFRHDDSDIENRRDFYALETLYIVLNEEDSEEFYIDEQNHVFKLDNAASFNLDFAFMGLVLHMGENSLIKEKLRLKLDFTEYGKYKIILKVLTDKFGKEAEIACVELFEHFAAFDETLLDEAYKTLDEVYPKWLSSYYCKFVLIRKAECARFLREIGKVD